jgi:hypothetical protein
MDNKKIIDEQRKKIHEEIKKTNLLYEQGFFDEDIKQDNLLNEIEFIQNKTEQDFREFIMRQMYFKKVAIPKKNK